jgi:hypothetical protein
MTVCFFGVLFATAESRLLSGSVWRALAPRESCRPANIDPEELIAIFQDFTRSAGLGTMVAA